MDLLKLTASQIALALSRGEISAAEVFDFYRNRAQKFNPKLNSFVEIYSQTTTNSGKSALTGIPIAIKDNICIYGKRITCASKILANHIAAYDATVIKRLRAAGLNIIGTTNMDEFAFGSSTENSCYNVAKNPWDFERVSGGSSGGSAAAVAARLVPLALGSDTGGSIRQPASLCGVVGFKPTYGRVSRFGLIAFGSSLDQIGPLTTNFSDCAQLLNIICGPDENDATCSKQPILDFTQSLVDDLSNVKIGLPQEYFTQGLNSEVKVRVEQAIELFKARGAIIVPISLKHTQYAVSVYYIIASSEASSNLSRFDGVRYGLRQPARDLNSLYTLSRAAGFGPESKRRIFLGTYSLSSGYYQAYYLRALKARRLIKEDFDQAFKQVDLILTPTSPTPAFKLGEKTQDPLAMYLSDIYTISANLAGLPAVSFPCGFTQDKNLPVGLQLIAKEFDESSLIRAGYSYQCATNWHEKIPELG